MDFNQQVGTWGDMGDGTYRNPILFADYSDPDCIRVGDDYWMICSEFNFMGMPILHSKDLVNWEVAGRVYASMEGYDRPRYGEGSWAPSIRYHNGTFYIFFCTPKDGLFMTSAKDPRGEWTPLHCVKKIAGWEDPCPFWDDDGTAYLGHSILGAGPIILHRMSEDGRELLDEGTVIYEGENAEGTKLHKFGGKYFLVIPEGHVVIGYEVALRSDSIYGPYERRVILDQKNNWVNGPHQGALVDTQNGEWWFLHFSSTGVSGRVVHLQPVIWENGWPMIGEPVLRNKKPNLPFSGIFSPKTTDDFASDELGFQWQWTYNPVPELWSLTERPGFLRLYGTQEEKPLNAPNVLTQRLVGACGLARVTIDLTNAAEGQKTGLFLWGSRPAAPELFRTKDGIRIYRKYCGGSWIDSKETVLTIQLSMQYFTECQFSVKLGDQWIPLSEEEVTPNVWKGARLALCTFGGEGFVDFSNFEYYHDGPNGLAK